MSASTAIKNDIHWMKKKKKPQPKRLILHRATTINRDKMIRQFAVAMGGTKLTEKVSEGDIISR